MQIPLFVQYYHYVGRGCAIGNKDTDTKLCDIGTIKDLFARHGLVFHKSLGQNFLISERVIKRIAEESNIRGYGLLEVGPGIGTLTVELAELAEKVCTVEIDRELMPVLDETLAGHTNIKIVNADIMKTDIPALTATELNGLPLAACANLPYYITTPALEALVNAQCFEKIIVMVQKEAARRMCAVPGSTLYGAFTTWLSYYYSAKVLFDVPAGCFMPAPKVDSSVIVLSKWVSPPCRADNERLLFTVIKAAFARRRKTILNALTAGVANAPDRIELTDILIRCGVAPERRGETISVCDFARIANEINTALCRN